MRIHTTVSDKTILSEERVVDIIKAAAVRFFPKVCSCCGRRFNSMKEYLESTAHLSQPRSYDADMQDWQPKKPLGVFLFSTCSCGNTLTLSSSSLDVETNWQLLAWLKMESQRRDSTISELLDDLRAKVNTQVLKSHK